MSKELSQKERCEYHRIMTEIQKGRPVSENDIGIKDALERLNPNQTNTLRLFTLDYLVREQEAETTLTEILKYA